MNNKLNVIHCTNSETLELTTEMTERIDEIDNAVYEMLCTLLEVNEDEFEWNMHIIGSVLDSVIKNLWESHGLKVRYPGIVKNEDGSQEYFEYDVMS